MMNKEFKIPFEFAHLKYSHKHLKIGTKFKRQYELPL